MNLVKCGVTRDGLREQVQPAAVQRQCGASCKFLKKALNSLHRIDDFDSEYIGSGFFSHIFKVVHKVTKQVMVLKRNVKTTNLANVRKEIQLMNQFSHPNMIKFYGVCITDGHMHALVEYINGGSLEQLLADKSIDLPWTLRIHVACDIAKGVKYLHSKGYMHRDLTSKNILIKKFNDGRRVAVVADLGLADKIPDPEKQVSSVGSPYWMAPECILGKRYNEKADVFSYGIVLCEIIARVEADPDMLPRTKKFGVDYVEFSKMSSDCPLHLLHQAFICCQIEPSKRPSFERIVTSLQEMKSSAQMAVILADLGRLGIVNSGKNVLSRMLLEKILDEKLKQRKRSADDGHHTAVHTTPSSAQPARARQTACGSSPTVQSTETPCQSSTRHRFVPVTPMIVGKVMSRDDVYYAPQQGNPFPERFRSAKWIDGGRGSRDESRAPSHFDNDRGILDDCSEFLELHSPRERFPKSQCHLYQQRTNHPRSLHLTCFAPVVLPDLSSTPSSASSFSRLTGRLQRSNSLPGSPSSLFEQTDRADAATSNLNDAMTSGQFKSNSDNFSSTTTTSTSNVDLSPCTRDKLYFFRETLVSAGAERTSDASEYGSSSVDSALGSDVAGGRCRKPRISSSGTGLQRHHRINSATVCRSSSTVYPQFEEAALLARYFEMCKRDSLNSSRNSSCHLCDDDDDDDDVIEFHSPLCNYQLDDGSSSSAIDLQWKGDDPTSPLDSPVQDDRGTSAEFEEPSLGRRDDPGRRSKERFLELVRNWEGRVDVENSKGPSAGRCRVEGREGAPAGEEASKDALGRRSKRPKLMEFAEFYLLRRFQELRQKWERRQQVNAVSKGSKFGLPSGRRDSDETVRNSPEKSDSTGPRT